MRVFLLALCLLLAGCLGGAESSSQLEPEGTDDPQSPTSQEGSEAQPIDGEPADCNKLAISPGTFGDPTQALNGFADRDAHLLFAVDASFVDSWGATWQDEAKRLAAGMDRIFYDEIALHIVPVDFVVLEFNASELPSVSNTDTDAMFAQAELIDAAIIEEMEARFAHVARDSTQVFLGADVAGSIAGKAYCIGGAKYQDIAYVWGEAARQDDRTLLVLTPFQDQNLKIATHEFGHMMGAHHHYANCIESAPSYTTEDSLATCTLMYNDAGLLQDVFSTANQLAMRAWADEVDL